VRSGRKGVDASLQRCQSGNARGGSTAEVSRPPIGPPRRFPGRRLRPAHRSRA
jgi:hypothetical protein